MSEPDVTALLTVAQAIAILDAAPVAPRVVRVPLAQARGLYLAADLTADRDYPPFDKSLMDGYAVRSTDVAAAPATLRVVGEVAAGQRSDRTLAPGEAVSIMTGAPIPPGADGVVPIEDTSRDDRAVHVRRAADPRRFIARRASDTPAGRTVLRAGVRLEAAQIAVAATVGAAHVDVHPRPHVAVLATGDEVIPVDAAPAGSQIRNSNSPMIVALLQRLGCDVTDLGVARDDPDTIRAAIARGLAFDALFVTGGMSMGAYDYVPGLLAEAGFDLRITKLRIKPGKPFVFGVREGSGVGVRGSANSTSPHPSSILHPPSSPLPTFAFGLPGNPVSGFACTARLASRLLTRLAGGRVIERWLPARLAHPLPANGPREFYQPARLDWSADGPIVTALNWKGSADLFTLAQADALLVREENEPALGPAAVVRVLEI